MVRNHGAGLLEDSPTRASPEPQVRPPAPCFTVRSQGRDMPPDIRPMCFGAPDFLSCPLVNDALESRRAHRALQSGAADDSPPAKPPPDNHPRPHLTSESLSSLQDWAARTSPLTARRVVLAPPWYRPSFRGTSSRATCRIRSPPCSEETCMRTRATFRPHFGHLIPSPFRDFASARAIAPPSTRLEPALQ